MACFPRIWFPLAALLLSGACASVIEGSSDPVKVAASPASDPTCVLRNARGAWNTRAADSVRVKRSRSDLSVSCIDAVQGTSGDATLASDIEPWAFGNILLGGIVGLVVDWSTGAAYTYPSEVPVAMRGASVPVPEEVRQAPIAPPVAPAAPMAVPAPAPVSTPAPVKVQVPASVAPNNTVDIIYPQVETVYDVPDAQGGIAVPPVFVVPGRMY